MHRRDGHPLSLAGVPTDASFWTLGGQQPAARFGPADPSVLIAIAPALGVRADYYRPLAELLVERGGGRIAAVTFDLLGTGRSLVRPSRAADWGYQALTRHFAALRAAVRAEQPRAAFVWLGHSLGGQIALLDGEHADAVILVASGSPYFRAWEGLGKARLWLGTTVSAAIAQVLGHFPGEQLGFGGREPRRWAREWARLSRTAQDEAMRRGPHNRWPRSAGFVVDEALGFLEREKILAP